jgi:hypothetical protein
MNRRDFLSTMAVAGMTGLLAQPDPAYAKDGIQSPIISESDEVFLASQARSILDRAELLPGQSNGKWRNDTPYAVHVPGGNMGYPAFWVRDAVMMLESDFISLTELEGWIRLIASVVRNKDWNVRPGVMVPAFAVPDHVNLNGKACFYPGSYETGSKQGGSPWGKYPPLDDQFYFIFTVYHHWRTSGSTNLFRSPVKTAFGPMQLSELCERIYRMAPSDAETQICTAGDVDTENAKDFGFCDSVSKSGKLLFPSILKFVAAGRIAELFSAAGVEEKATAFRVDARKIKAAIPKVFLHLSSDGNEAWLDSATEVGHQADVWGSAYAVYSDAMDPATAHKLSRALVRAYREKTAVREGCVRNLLSNDAANRNGWQSTVSPLGVYQNGGFWGTPVGWYLVAMYRSDKVAAAEMASDYLGFLRRNRDPDGLSQAWEWFNPDTGKTANPLYVATVALPYGCLRAAGLTGEQKQPVNDRGSLRSTTPACTVFAGKESQINVDPHPLLERVE